MSWSHQPVRDGLRLRPRTLALLLGVGALLSACGDTSTGMRSSQRLASMATTATDRTIFDVEPGAGSVVTIGVVGLVGAYLPSRLVLRVDPVVALREE